MNLVKLIAAAAFALLSAGTFAAVDINKANQAELESVKGIGPAMSGRILDARKSGAFKDWSDLQARVKGVRGGNSAKFSGDGLTVNGAAYAAQATSDASPRAPRAPKAERPARAAAAAPAAK